MSVKLTALRPLSGDYGFVPEGWSFTTDEQTAEELETRGLAERYRDRPIVRKGPPENKKLEPAENKFTRRFRK